MAALCPSLLRTYLRRQHTLLFLLKSSKQSRIQPIQNRYKLAQCASFSTTKLSSQTAGEQEESINKDDLPKDFEVSYEDFKYVEPLLPAETVPEIPQHESYPTPSGWFPPNEALRSQQKYMVTRSRNGLLPVYTQTERVYKNAYHTVTIKNIEGDIWAMEADLKNFLSEKLEGRIITQVHEARRLIRVRGLHSDLIAEFLFDRGM